MPSLATVLAGAAHRPDGFAVDVPETWHQGRTAYGGFSSALALAAAYRAGGGGLAPLRSAQLAMLAPVYGRVGVRAQVERTGRNATWIAAQIVSEKGTAFTASFVFMGPADSALDLNERPLPPGVVPFRQALPVVYPGRPSEFLANHFEAREAMPHMPMRRPDICRWMRLTGGDDQLAPMLGLLLLADALPPAVLPMFDRAVPVSTMHWQANLLTSRPETEDGWWLLRSESDYAGQGGSSQRMGVWNTSGHPVVSGIQSVAMFG